MRFQIYLGEYHYQPADSIARAKVFANVAIENCSTLAVTLDFGREHDDQPGQGAVYGGIAPMLYLRRYIDVAAFADKTLRDLCADFDNYNGRTLPDGALARIVGAFLMQSGITPRGARTDADTAQLRMVQLLTADKLPHYHAA